MAVDFGTVNSCVAFIDNAPGAKPEPIPDPKTKRLFVPSMMLFVDTLHPYQDWLLHGPDVGNKAFEFSRGIVDCVKRAIEEDTWPVYDATYKGDQLATWIIEQLLLEAARRHHCCPERVAMTLPAAFWGPKRERMLFACKEACTRAWRNAERISVTPIDEPTAAAMYFCSHHAELVADPIESGKTVRVLVFDFGGGTLDISVVGLFKGEDGRLTAEPYIARGDNHMGGVDIDLEVLRSLAKLAQQKCPQIDVDALSLSRWKFAQHYESRKGFAVLQSMRVSW